MCPSTSPRKVYISTIEVTWRLEYKLLHPETLRVLISDTSRFVTDTPHPSPWASPLDLLNLHVRTNTFFFFHFHSLLSTPFATPLINIYQHKHCASSSPVHQLGSLQFPRYDLDLGSSLHTDGTFSYWKLSIGEYEDVRWDKIIVSWNVSVLLLFFFYRGSTVVVLLIFSFVLLLYVKQIYR